MNERFLFPLLFFPLSCPFLFVLSPPTVRKKLLKTWLSIKKILVEDRVSHVMSGRLWFGDVAGAVDAVVARTGGDFFGLVTGVIWKRGRTLVPEFMVCVIIGWEEMVKISSSRDRKRGMERWKTAKTYFLRIQHRWSRHQKSRCWWKWRYPHNYY